MAEGIPPQLDDGDASSTHFDVAIIGTGSGNSIITPDFDGKRIAIIERDIFGGTCLNRGCIPTKMFVYTADVAAHIRHADRYGIDATVDKVHWPEIVDRIFSRIDPIPPSGKAYRESLPHVTVFTAEARFVDARTLALTDAAGATQQITADDIVIAVGARAVIPAIEGLDAVEHHTSDTIMRLAALPEHLIVVGGGFIAAEMAHVFASLGSAVTIINRSSRLLSGEDEAISQRFTELAANQYDLRLDTTITRVTQKGATITVDVRHGDETDVVHGDALLIATGRRPNSDTLDVAAAGIEVDAHGYVITDPQQRTNVPGVWALGDVSNDNQLKHTANAEARTVAHNLAHPDDLRATDLWPIPHAVFASPQIAAVGLTEQALRHEGQPYITATQRYGDVAYGWAMEDTDHFCKVIADPQSRRLLGAHIIGPDASMLLQQLVQGMKFGQTVDEIARGQLYIHPALTEVVENALLQL